MRQVLLSIACGSLLVLAGCSSKGTITGKVTYQERPLTGGTILFTSTQGKGVGRSQIGEDGSYTITNMPAGPVKVSVETKSAQGTATPTGRPPSGMQPPKDVMPKDVKSGVYGTESKKGKPELIPEYYGDPDKSGLEYTLTGGNQSHDVKLK